MNQSDRSRIVAVRPPASAKRWRIAVRVGAVLVLLTLSPLNSIAWWDCGPCAYDPSTMFLDCTSHSCETGGFEKHECMFSYELCIVDGEIVPYRCGIVCVWVGCCPYPD